MSPKDHKDHNLLFGLLTLQNRVATEEQLLAAMQRWTFDQSTPLAELLEQSGAISSSQRAALEQMLDAQALLHNGDISRSLAAVDAATNLSSLAFDVSREVQDDRLRRSLGHLVEPTGEPAGSTEPAATKTMPWVGHVTNERRFHILRPLAKGGLGEVFVALDRDLNRQVAVKEIRPERAFDSDCQIRFILEAEVTGGLEHPGIVPVYGLATHADGRPYYAMRLIHGQSLNRAIDQFHQSEESAEQRNLRFRGLLQAFVAVCDAIAYAHHRGVLHRDIKPENIMLGNYGEALVVDWGLSKVLSQPASNPQRSTDDEAPLAPLSGDSNNATLDGNALGTPGYLSPEQAAGKHDRLQPATDIYALGATLYHLLTGVPSQNQKDLAASLERTIRGEVAAPRTINPGVPKALEAICQRAMETDSESRYATASQLGEDVSRYLSDERVLAFNEPAWRRVHRWAREHSTIAASSAALVLVCVIGFGAFSAVIGAKNRSLVRATQQAAEAKASAERSREAARQQSQLALSTLATVIHNIQDNLKGFPGSGELRRDLLSMALKRLDGMTREYLDESNVDAKTYSALYRMGDVVLRFGSDGETSAVELAMALYKRSHAIAEQMAEANPLGPQDFEWVSNLALSEDRIGNVHLRNGRVDLAAELYESARRLRESIAEVSPNVFTLEQLSVSYSKLGDAASMAGDDKLAMEFFEQYLDVVERFVKLNPQKSKELFFVNFKLGDGHANLGSPDKALKHFRQALIALQPFPNDVDTEYRSAILHERIGSNLVNIGETEAAKEELLSSISILEQLRSEDGANKDTAKALTSSYNAIGRMLLNQDDTNGAQAHFEKAYKIRKALLAADPADGQSRRDVALSISNLGRVSKAKRDYQSAAEHFEEALLTYKSLSEKNQTNSQAAVDLLRGIADLAQVRSLLGEHAEALRLYTESHEVAKRSNKPFSIGLSLVNIAGVHYQFGEYEKAIELYRKGLAIRKELADQGSVGDVVNLGFTQKNLADTLKLTGNMDDAIRHYREAVNVRERVAIQRPTNLIDQRNLALSHEDLATALGESEHSEQAEPSFEAALRLREQLVKKTSELGDVHDLSNSHIKHAAILIQRQAFKEAMPRLKAAIETFSPLELEGTPNYVQRTAAYALDLAASAERAMSNPEEAAKFSEQAVIVRRRLAPASEENQLGLAYSCIELASTLHEWFAQQRDKRLLIRAADACEEGLAIRQRLIQLDQVDGPNAFPLLATQFIAGELQRDLGQLDDALKQQQEVSQRTQQVIERTGDSVDMKFLIFLWHCRKAGTLSRQAKFEEAIKQLDIAKEIAAAWPEQAEAFEEALAEIEEAVAICERSIIAMQSWDALVQRPANELPELLALRGRSMARLGKLEEAIKAVKELVKLASEASQEQYCFDRATIYALCVESVLQEANTGLTTKPSDLTPEQQAAVESWTQQCVETLQSALKRGETTWAKIQKAPELDAVREAIPTPVDAP